VENFLKVLLMNIEKRLISIWISLILFGSILVTIDIPFGEKLGLIGTVEGTTITVDDSGGRDHTTIQNAIDAANTGDTVYVYAGTYFENIVISGKTINLTGEDRDTTIIDSNWLFGSGFKIESDHNNISGITVKNGYYGMELNASCFNSISDCKIIETEYGGIYLADSCNNSIYECICRDDWIGIDLDYNSNNNSMESNVLELNDYHGLRIRGGSTNNAVLGNLIQANNQVGFPANYPGFWLEADNNNITKNNIINNLGTSVCMNDASNNSIFYNNLTNNAVGIELKEDSNDNDIFENTFQHNDYYGIWLHYNSNGNYILNNYFSNNNVLQLDGYSTILLNTSRNRISGNVIDGNELVGISMSDTTQNRLDNNTITSSLYGIYLNNVADNDIENNTCTSNTKNGIYIDSSVNNTLYNNSCSDNPDHGIYLKDSDNNLLGQNDVSYNNVDTVWNFVGLTGFEKNNDEGWKHQGIGDCWERGAPASGPGAAYEGNNGWGTNLAGKYPDNADFSLYSPELYIGKGTSVEFWHWYDMENGWDFARLEISRDGGLTWDLMHSYTGSSGGWTLENIGLDDYSGNVIIRFRITSDANLGLAGWYIDNISLTNHDYQDLESDTDDGWTHGGTGDTWERGFPNSGPGASLSGDNVWGTNLSGKYQNDTDFALYSPSFDLLEGTTLSFWHWYDIEAIWDAAYLEISDDGGIDWDSLASYDGTLDDWEQVEISLDGYSGIVQIRFRLNTDVSMTYDGWYIDDISFLGSGGIHLETSDGNILANNTCIETGGNGIFLESSANNDLIDNNCSVNRKNGVYAESSNNNDILRNSISDNLENGLFMESGMVNNIENNTVYRNVDGILLDSSNLNNLKNNYVLNNSDKGIDIKGSENNNISDNVVSNNWNNGIDLDNSNNNNIINNTVTLNWNNGIELDGSTNNIIAENNYSSNLYDGIHLYNSDNNAIIDNLCEGNWDDGISIEFSWNCVISKNTCSNNWWYGIYLYNFSAFNSVDNNTCDLNEFGIVLEEGSQLNLIENNSCSNSWSDGLLLYDSYENTIIYNNLISNSYYGIYIYDVNSEDNIIHHNSFLFNNDSSFQAWDNGFNNSWDDGFGEGNFWENYSALYQQATNDEHIWDTPYNISGPADATDRYPLFYAGPGADTELPRLIRDSTPDQATTGDPISFSAEFADNLGIVTVHVLFSYDGLNWPNNETMVLSREGVWSYTTTVDTDATDLYYTFYLKDMGRNHVIIGITQLGVQDNDPPQLIADNTLDSATTNDMFVFSVNLGDNVGIVSASVYYSFNGNDYDNKDLIKEMGDTWSTTITIAEDATELYYYIAFSDGTNSEESAINTVQVTDNDAPTLVMDNTPLFGTTGDPFTFDVEVMDNYEIDTVFVYYSHDDSVYQSKELTDDGQGFWNGEIILELNFTELFYYFKVTDDGNPSNELTTDKAEIPVNDNDPPTARAGVDLLLEMNADVIFDATSSTDNIGIVEYSWSFSYDGVEIELTGKLEGFTFEIPGKYVITLTVSDDEGNWAKDTLNITVVDDSKPSADAGDDITTDQHEEVTLSGKDSSDDIALSDFTWTFIYNYENITLHGENTSFVFDEAGFYEITLNVTDAGGNWATDTLKVTVNDIEKPHANAGDDQEVEEGTTVTMNGGYSTDNVAIISFIWSFYDGLERTYYGETITYKFKTPGEYSITLTVTDASGNSATDTVKIDVTGISQPNGHELPDFWNNTVDEDNDGLDDRWEEYYFDGDASPYADPDHDGYKNIQEYLKRTDPTKKETEPPETGSGSSSGDKKAGSEDWWTWIMIGGILFLIIVIILFFIIKSRRSKDVKDKKIPEIEVDHEESFDDVEDSKEDVTEVISSSLETESTDSEFEELAETYNNCREYGMDMSDYEFRYREIEKAVKLGQEDATKNIAVFITELEDAYFSYYEDLKNNTKKLHKTINADFKKAMGSGMDIGQLRPNYETAIDYFKEGDFHGAMELFTVVKGNLDKSFIEKQTGEEERTDGSADLKKTEKRKLDLDSLFSRILPPAGPRRDSKEKPNEDDGMGTDHISDLSKEAVEHKELAAGGDDVTEEDEADEQEVGILSPIVK